MPLIQEEPLFASLPPLIEFIGTSTIPKIPSDLVLNEREICDLELLLNGTMSPLLGYLDLNNYLSCVKNMKLTDGSIWPIPIVLKVPFSGLMEASEADMTDVELNDTQLTNAHQILNLRDDTNALLARLTITSVFKPDLQLEIDEVLGQGRPCDPNHPYATYLMENYTNCIYVGGNVTALSNSPIHFDYRQYRLTPADARQLIQERGWKYVVGFQTRNPMHRSHFELTKQALADVKKSLPIGEPEPNLLISPAVGPTQPGDIDFRVRVRCYQLILRHYEVEPLLVLIPIAMRMAGPREAVWHALMRKNYGCTHFIVGRDHAGPSVKRLSDQTSFYEPYAAHDLLRKFENEIGIRPVFGKSMVYAGAKHSYIQEDKLAEIDQKTLQECPRAISGTRFREMLRSREPVPEWFCFPDIVAELRLCFKPFHACGLCVYFTGLPCSGKSTLANALRALLLESPLERRVVTILDADVIRTHLSKGLGFSKLDRSVNVRRIGYVAHEIAKHGGICLVANIAPFKEDRLFNRRLVESANAVYIEVFVSTPISVCESRDVKELYKKARLGVIKQFTGVSDPYEVPEKPELVIDSSCDLADKAENIYSYLKERQYIL